MSIAAFLAGALKGGFQTNQQLEGIEREEAAKAAQLALQRDQLARAIAQDQSTRAHQQRLEAQADAQQKSLDDQRLFQQSEAMVKAGYKGPVTRDQMAKLHPTTRALAFKEIERPEAGGLVGLDGTAREGNPLAPKAEDWTPLYEQKESETERLRIAELNAQQRATAAALGMQRGDLDRRSREEIAASDRQARIMAAAIAASGRNPANKPITGLERKELAFFNRMLEAERNARKVEGEVGEWDATVSQMAPGFLENWLKTAAGQRYTQAQRSFTEARLREESGAAVPIHEYDADRATNFKAPGDDPTNLAQKRGSRLTTLRGLGVKAGRALQDYYGEDATVDSLLQEFAEQQQQASAPGAPGAPATNSLYQQYLKGNRP